MKRMKRILLAGGAVMLGLFLVLAAAFACLSMYRNASGQNKTGRVPAWGL